MPPFTYTDYHDPNAGSIGELIARRGDIAARAVDVRGRAWAGAAQNIGGIIANTASDVARYRLDAPRRQLEALQVDSATQAVNDDKLFRQALSLAPNGDLAPAVSFLKSQGGAGIVALQKLTAMVQQQQQVHDEDAAQIGFAIHSAGNTPEAVQSVLTDAVQKGKLPPQEASQFYQQAIGDPTKIAALSRSLISRAAWGREALMKTVDIPEGGTAINPLTKDVVVTGQPKPKPDYTVNGQRFSGVTNQPLGDAVPPQPAAAQTHNMRLKGVGDVPVDYVPNKDGSGGTWMYQGKDVTGDVSVIPAASITIHNQQQNVAGDFTKTGDDFLETIPRTWRSTVKKIATYDEDPSKSLSMRGGMRDQMTAWVNQYNPAYKADEFAVRAPTRKAFTIGTQGQQINAMNTAIGHIDQITGLVAQLNNSSFVPGNKIVNSLRTMFGSDKVTNFDTLKDALAGEVASILSKGSATVSGIAEAKEKIHAANSPEQLAGYVKTLIPVMGSKLASLDYQYHQAMGAEDQFSALSPESKRILEKYGFDPAHPTIDPSHAAGITVTSPGGTTYTFKSQAEADAAVAAAKAKGLWR